MEFAHEEERIKPWISVLGVQDIKDISSCDFEFDSNLDQM